MVREQPLGDFNLESAKLSRSKSEFVDARIMSQQFAGFPVVICQGSHWHSLRSIHRAAYALTGGRKVALLEEQLHRLNPSRAGARIDRRGEEIRFRFIGTACRQVELDQIDIPLRLEHRDALEWASRSLRRRRDFPF